MTKKQRSPRLGEKCPVPNCPGRLVAIGQIRRCNGPGCGFILPGRGQ